ncbi:MAG TPA: L-threonylcarbamoyladenylate synthase [Opitutaceae bacterium]|nr:L-threonylcarbamoyladenylate synthase [Opitutaceae bacterium]
MPTPKKSPRTARLYRGSPANLARLARLLRNGELVGVPTETVYGLAANALDARACRKIFAAKGRPAHDPLIVHIASLRDLPLVAVPNSAALKLAKKFWPGPLTLVLPKTPAIPTVVSAGLPSVAVRMPAHPLFRRLLKLAGVPLAAPSANPFGYVSPTTAAHVQESLGRKISHILDGGASRIGLESTIIDLRNPRKPRLLRPGAITLAQLERALGTKVARPPVAARAPAKKAQVAPGLLARHYSPRTPVVLHEAMRASAKPAVNEAWLFVAKPGRREHGKNVFWLDDRGDLRGAARRLFAMLRQLDGASFNRINAELARGDGLADAINDRLRRAAAK